MAKAAAAGQAPSFFARARGALQNDLATRWNIASQDVTAAEVQARLGDSGADILQIFALADETNYAGQPLTTTDFERWTHAVRSRLFAEPAA